jgi:hypothetical protein
MPFLYIGNWLCSGLAFQKSYSWDAQCGLGRGVGLLGKDSRFESQKLSALVRSPILTCLAFCRHLYSSKVTRTFEVVIIFGLYFISSWRLGVIDFCCNFIYIFFLSTLKLTMPCISGNTGDGLHRSVGLLRCPILKEDAKNYHAWSHRQVEWGD